MVIQLEKTGDSYRINLSKEKIQQIHVNLNWNAHSSVTSKGRNWLEKRIAAQPQPADLDLGCMYELDPKAGQFGLNEKGVIQALGNSFGSKTSPPFVFLDKDDRSGASADGENLYLMRPEVIRRVLTYAFVYEGGQDFRHLGASLSIRLGGVEQVYLLLDNSQSGSTFCAAAMITYNGDQVEICKEARYFNGHSDCDRYYGFGFQWTAGRK